MEFTLTSKGQCKLLRDNYMYTYQKELANDVSSWECVLSRRGQCRERMKLLATGDFLQIVNGHTHPPTPTECNCPGGNCPGGNYPGGQLSRGGGGGLSRGHLSREQLF